MGMFKKRYVTTVLAHTQPFLDTKKYISPSHLGIRAYLEQNRNIEHIDLNAKSLAQYLIEANDLSLLARYKKAMRYFNKKPFIFSLPTSSYTQNKEQAYYNNVEKFLKKHYKQKADYILIGEPNVYHETFFILVQKYRYSFKTNTLIIDNKTWQIENGFIEYNTHLEPESLKPIVLNFYDGLVYTPNVYFNAQKQKYPHLVERGFIENNRYGAPVLQGDIFYYPKDYNIDTPPLVLDPLMPHPPRAPMDNIKTGADTVAVLHLMDFEGQKHVLRVSLNEIFAPSSDGVISKEFAKVSAYIDGDLFNYGLGTNAIEEIETIKSKAFHSQYIPRLYLYYQERNVLDLGGDYLKHATKLSKILDFDYKSINQSVTKDLEHTRYCYITPQALLNQNTLKKDNVIIQYYYFYFKKFYDLNIKNAHLDIKDKGCIHAVVFSNLSLKKHRGQYKNLQVNDASFVHENNKVIIYYQHDGFYHALSVHNLHCVHAYDGYFAPIYAKDEKFSLPIDMLVLHNLPLRSQQKLMYMATTLQVNIVHRRKKKWYESKYTKKIVAVAGVLISVFSGGTGAPFVATVMKIAAKLALSYVINLAVKLAIQLLIKLGFSPKAIAAITFAAQVYSAFKGGFKGFNPKSAVALIKMVNPAFDAYQKINAYKIDKIQRQMAAHELAYADNQKRLDEAKKQLQLGFIPIRLENDLLHTTPIVFAQTPAQFYNSKMAVDVINLSYAGVFDYVSMAKQITPANFKHNALEDGYGLN